MTLPALLKHHQMDVGCLHSGEHNHEFVSCASMTHSSQTQKMKMYDSKQSFKNDPLFMSITFLPKFCFLLFHMAFESQR